MLQNRRSLWSQLRDNVGAVFSISLKRGCKFITQKAVYVFQGKNVGNRLNSNIYFSCNCIVEYCHMFLPKRIMEFIISAVITVLDHVVSV